MKRKAIIIVLLFAAIAIGGYVYHYDHAKKEASSSALLYYGNVELRRVNMSFRVGGRVAEILAEEGEVLAKGQVFARLDREPLDVEVAAAQAARDQTAATLEKTVNGPRRQELEEARAQVEEYKATLVQAETELARNRGLFSKNAVSQSGYETTLFQRDVAKARLARAESIINLLEEGARKEDVEIARAALAQADAALKKAKIAAADAELVAPNDGILLTRVVEPGAMTTAGQTVATLSIRDVVWVYIFVEEPDLGKIAQGTRVEIRTDSSDKVYTGHVGYISPEAEFTPKTVETPNLRTNLVYRTRVVVEAPDDGLRQGAPVDVKVLLDSRNVPTTSETAGDYADDRF